MVHGGGNADAGETTVTTALHIAPVMESAAVSTSGLDFSPLIVLLLVMSCYSVSDSEPRQFSRGGSIWRRRKRRNTVMVKKVSAVNDIFSVW